MTCDGEDRTDRELLIITPLQTMGFEFFFFFFFFFGENKDLEEKKAWFI